MKEMKMFLEDESTREGDSHSRIRVKGKELKRRRKKRGESPTMIKSIVLVYIIFADFNIFKYLFTLCEADMKLRRVKIQL